MITTYTRSFQYKLLNNILYTNKDLYRFKIRESPRYSFCFTHLETVEHIFVTCPESKNLYFRIVHWLNNFGICLPEQKYCNIILGVDEPPPVNHILSLHKIPIYKARESGLIPTLQHFKNVVEDTKFIEYKIALKQGKLEIHYNKWEKLLQCITMVGKSKSWI